jgi:D-alanyl-lipoteichoic acid acyltransferase DltB (MBOAT superfamily)
MERGRAISVENGRVPPPRGLGHPGCASGGSCILRAPVRGRNAVITGAIDLFEFRFWVVVGLGLVLLTPIASIRGRSVAMALVNLVMLRLLLGGERLPWVAVFLGVVGLFTLSLHLSARSARPWLWPGACLAVVAILFVGSKVAPRLQGSSTSPLWTFLALISFSYVFLRSIEVLRAVAERRHAPPNVVDAFNYLVPFHMLAAGPIQSYDDFRAGQIVPQPLTGSEALAAVERIAFGLFKKFVLAGLLEQTALTGFRSGGWYFFIEVQLFFLWLYLDFSAYSDIAVGVGRLLGIRTPENFDRPYLARNMIDFWERWHMTLSQWLRRNLFIPLQLAMTRGLPKVSPLATSSAALFVTFMFGGLWHGFSAPFLGWGLMHAVAIVATNAYRAWLQHRLGRKGIKAYLDRPGVRAVSTFLTYQYAAFSVVPFVYPWGES